MLDSNEDSWNDRLLFGMKETSEIRGSDLPVRQEAEVQQG